MNRYRSKVIHQSSHASLVLSNFLCLARFHSKGLLKWVFLLDKRGLAMLITNMSVVLLGRTSHGEFDSNRNGFLLARIYLVMYSIPPPSQTISS